MSAGATGAWILRLLAIGVALYLLQDLGRQFLAGAISMGYGEFDDRIVVTRFGDRLLAVLMWGVFLLGILLAGIRPALYTTYRWLLPALLVTVFVLYVLFSVGAQYRLQ